MTSSTCPKIVLLGALAAAVLTGCSGHNAAATAPPDPTVTDLQHRAALASALSFSGTYAVTDSTDTAAVVRVWVTPSSYRVEVTEGTVTAALYGTPTGTVACPEQVGQAPACYTVAAAGAAVPSTFDAGIERVFTRDLPALAAGASAFQVTSVAVPTTVTVAGTRCFRVERSPGAPAISQSLVQLVDVGTYCLGTDGAPVQLGFASGTLTLSSRGTAPAPTDLQVPATPQPLPAGVLPTASATASATASLPRVFGQVTPNPSPAQ